MPIPTPAKGEEKKIFIERCMSDDVMKKEYPDNDQRFAICQTQWKEKKSIHGAMPFIERRYVPIEDTEFRFDTEKNEIEGYAALLNIWTPIMNFQEMALPKAFKKTIKENDIRSTFNHEPNLVLGRNTSGTLEIKEDSKGVYYRAKLPNTTYANDLRVLMDRGDVTQSSYGFQVIKDIWEDNFKKRSLVEVKLFDVGPVTFPAETKTEAKLRSAFAEFGLDYNTLNFIILKSNREMELMPDEIKILKDTIEILNNYIPQNVPPDKHTLQIEPEKSTLFDKMLEHKNQVRKILGGLT